MSSWTIVVVALGSVVLLWVGKRYLTKARHGPSHPYPPGPPGLPFVGNVIGINMNAPWLTYAEWARTYGDLVYTRLLGKDIIVINSETVAKQLLEKRSWNYSDRPHMISNKLCGIDFNSAGLPYGDKWRLHRRFFHQTLRRDSVSRFFPIQHHVACRLLRRLLETPDQLSEHVFEYTASVILKTVYDYDVTSRQDKLVDIAARVLRISLRTVPTGVNILLGAFPVALKLPPWFPGMSFKKKLAVAREFSKQYIETPFAYTLQRMSSGSSSPSMIYDALRNVEEKGRLVNETWMEALKEASATGFLAASETSDAVLMTFFLMMVMSPEAQERAQAQIDAIVGRNRLPSIEDRPSLPYVDAVFRETLRYSPVVPLSIPHAALDDDVYAGYHIPKGAIILANIWSMAHNETKYPNPHQFIPERFLHSDGSLKPADIENIVFGFGRRICVARHFADASVWSVIAKVLAVFKISKALDQNGDEIPVEPKFSSGFGVHPLPFGFRIVPRRPEMDSIKLEELINQSTA